MYFFSNLKKVTDQHPLTVTFISDRGIGLLSACSTIFPNNPHLYCYHHLVQNLKLRYTGKGSKKMKDLVMKRFKKCAYSSTEKEFYHNLEDLRIAGGPQKIDSFLHDLPPQTWCRAFVLGSRFGVMANTVAESFNSWISVERTMAVYTMLEFVSSSSITSYCMLTVFTECIEIKTILDVHWFIVGSFETNEFVDRES